MYPKLRTDAAELLEYAATMLPWVRSLIAIDARLGLETFFERAGSYLCSLYHAGLDPARVAHFTRSAVLSRYVGITRWSVNRQRVLDMIWDTTDTMRPGHLRRHLLGLVCYDDGLRQDVAVDAAALSVPCC
jgi:hypothetical protein